MNVEGILSSKGSKVETISADASVVMAVHKLATMRIGALVVVGKEQEVEGVVAERDVVRGLNRHGVRVLEMRVGEIMSRDVPVCSPDATLTHVMARMTETRNRHVPVVKNNQLCGIVSIGDVIKHRLDEMELQANVLRDAYRASH